jgi:hypothetical protein
VGEVTQLAVLRIRDPSIRAAVRGRLANNGFVSVTSNIWESSASSSGDPDVDAEYWEQELRWFEETIDSQTDVIYFWAVIEGSMVRSTIGSGGSQ